MSAFEGFLADFLAEGLREIELVNKIAHYNLVYEGITSRQALTRQTQSESLPGDWLVGLVFVSLEAT